MERYFAINVNTGEIECDAKSLQELREFMIEKALDGMSTQYIFKDNKDRMIAGKYCGRF